jgi:glycosyltransferase involved in cell wall biosynthesis
LPAQLRVFTNHTSQFLEWAAGTGDLSRAKRCLLSADIVICPSKELADATIRAGFPAERVCYLPNGVDTERFHPGIDRQEVRRRLAIAEDEVVFLCSRRLEKKNGVPYWLRAIPAVLAGLEGAVKARFVLIGDYPGKDEYSDRANVLAIVRGLSMGDKLQWIGHVPPEGMPKHLAAADVCVLPSLMEATSIAGLEAMACARPLIGTRVGGIPEIVDDDSTGVLVPPADSAALAEAMILLARDPDLRGRMGQAARGRAVREFGWNAIGARTLALYADALSTKAHSFSRPHLGQ